MGFLLLLIFIAALCSNFTEKLYLCINFFIAGFNNNVSEVENETKQIILKG